MSSHFPITQPKIFGRLCSHLNSVFETVIKLYVYMRSSYQTTFIDNVCACAAFVSE